MPRPPIERRRPLPTAIALALALHAGNSAAQAFDPASPAVLQAYAASAGTDTLDAARNGLNILLARAALFPQLQPNGASGFYLGFVGFLNAGDRGFGFSGYFPSVWSANSFHSAGSDADLVPLGNPVVLSNAVLTATASFATARDFLIGPGPAKIDTAGFDLTIAGVVNASGRLEKFGTGTLALTGANIWAEVPRVYEGTLKGSTTSLQTSIDNAATVEFDQAFDGTYAATIAGTGALRKNGTGTVTLTAAQDYSGSTTVLQGRLALAGAGAVSEVSAVTVNPGAAFDLSAVTDVRRIGPVSGAGSIVLGTSTLNTVAPHDSTFAGVISGLGSFQKLGAGTLTLTGVNTHTGGTSATEGVLVLAGAGNLNPNAPLSVSSRFDMSAADGAREVGSIAGSGTIVLGSNALTVGRDNASTLFDGTIEGSGALTKTGSGTLTLSGATQHTGLTTIAQGTVFARTFSLGPQIVNHGTLVLTHLRDENNPASSPAPVGTLYTSYPVLEAYSGNISGSGRLVKHGNGIVWLRGENSYTGGTLIEDGILVGNDRSLPGNVVNQAGLAFYQSADGTYAGSVSGTGMLLKYGPGNLMLTGMNTHTGGTAFSGPLTIADDRNLGGASGAVIMAGGTLRIAADVTSSRAFGLAPEGGVFDTSGRTLTLVGPLTGPGNLTKLGAGTLALSGASTYTGATLVEAGSLAVSGSLTSVITLAPGATLSGTGSIGGLAASGVVAPGHPTGTLTVAGAANLLPGSSLRITADAKGDASRITAATASIQGASILVQAQDGNYHSRTRYAVLSTSAGVSGRFDSVSTNLAFLRPSLDYDGRNVFLDLIRNDSGYTAVAQTPTQAGIAGALDRLVNMAGTDTATVIAALDSLTAEQARAAFDSIGGVGQVGPAAALQQGQRALGQQTLGRLAVAEAGGRGPTNTLASVKLAFEPGIASDAQPVYAAALGAAGIEPHDPAAQHGFWMRGYGGRGRIDGTSGAADA